MYLCCRGGGKRKHEGLTLCVPMEPRFMLPFDVKLNGKAVPYKKNNAINDGINLSGEGLYLQSSQSAKCSKSLTAMQHNLLL